MDEGFGFENVMKRQLLNLNGYIKKEQVIL